MYRKRESEKEREKIIKLTTCKHGFLLTVIGRSAAAEAKIWSKPGRKTVCAHSDLKCRGACRRRRRRFARVCACVLRALVSCIFTTCSVCVRTRAFVSVCVCV